MYDNDFTFYIKQKPASQSTILRFRKKKTGRVKSQNNFN